MRNNYIKGRPDENKLDYGINIHDENHLVKDNWVVNVGQYHGIKIVGGNGPNDCNACHVRAKNIRVFGNTLVNSTLHLGKRYKYGEYTPPVNVKMGDLAVTCDRNYAMITGYGLEASGAFEGKPYTFTGVNTFHGTKLAYGNVLNNLKGIIKQGMIQWTKSPINFGDHGERMIRKIECEAGPSWETKKTDCLTLN